MLFWFIQCTHCHMWVFFRFFRSHSAGDVSTPCLRLSEAQRKADTNSSR
jgi:hypothetical protein